MFDRVETQCERVVIIQPQLTVSSPSADVAEIRLLAESAGAEVADVLICKLAKPTARSYIGRGKVEEVASLVKYHHADLIVFNGALSPVQERNIERECECRVLDRTGLILDIFAARAHSFEGKLQVELAQLRYLSTRLVRGWSHLERQRGGIGLRGPGETQLELDRRMIRRRIIKINQRLAKVQQTRELGRRARVRAAIPTIALVGYTNAGKSTLFNALTQAETYIADQLFATLDPIIRKMDVPGLGQVMLVDTVGFIRDLPHELVEAFSATLEETIHADLLLHVHDAANPERAEYAEQVHAVLARLNADHVKTLDVYNKIDLLSAVTPHIDYNNDNTPRAVWLSAGQKDGLDLIETAIAKLFSDEIFMGPLYLPPQMGRMRASLYAQQAIIDEEIDTEKGGWLVTVKIAIDSLNSLCKLEGVTAKALQSTKTNNIKAE